jgi:hypothetical protein
MYNNVCNIEISVADANEARYAEWFFRNISMEGTTQLIHNSILSNFQKQP